MELQNRKIVTCMRKRLLNMKSFLLTDWHISLQHWIRDRKSVV